MSKYYKAEDVIRNRAEDLADTSYWEYGNPKNVDEWIEVAEMEFADLPTIEVSEEDELKFYYVESIDDYWIGRRLDNFYYAEWRGDYFVWTHSRYLPWGEHVVNEQTLWKEHTYPSEPREIPFGEWIVGFMKKYGSKVSEDCISRKYMLEKAQEWKSMYFASVFARDALTMLKIEIENAPSVTTEQSSEVGEPKEDKMVSVLSDMIDNGWKIQF